MSMAHDVLEPACRCRPALAGTGKLWRGLSVVAALLSLFLVPARAADDEDEDENKTPPLSKELAALAQRYAGVTEWQGFWEASETRGFSKSNTLGHTRNTYEASGHGRFALTRDDVGWAPERGDFRWKGSGEASGTTSESMSSWSKWGPRMVGEDWQISGGGRTRTRQVEFTLWLGRQHASLHAGEGTGGAAPMRKVGHAVVALSSADGQHHYGDKAINETWSGAIIEFFIPNYEKETKNWVVAQGGPGVLVFEHEERHHVSIGGLRRSRVILTPVHDDLEVEVTIEGYAKWRPLGSIEKPAEPGNSLVACATLKSKTGKVKELPAVKRFTFELLDTSREPGVCLNWPLNAKDTDFDLRLAAAPKFPGKLSKKDQTNEVAQTLNDDNKQPYAETQIDSYDFGGRSSLLVRCTLDDGREILGLMKSEGGETGVVLVPKRFSGDWIAKPWREARRVVELAARADDENAPVGDGTKGDGLTLYEEYRGWAEDGKHVEGDPKTKDFFVQLKKAGVALPGIAKFQRLTGLNVHYKMTEQEFPQSRIINANRDRGPNVTDQHGVIVQIKKKQPGVSRAVGGPGNPKMIKSVDLMSDVASFSVAYVAITVAHELGHCVNLWHHGDADHKVGWVVVNGKLYEGRPDGTVTGEIFVVNEQLDNLTPTVVDMAVDIQAQPPPDNRFKLQMGRDQGQHSGFENCIMRYDDAQTFIYRARPDFRFWDFTEPLGNELCTTAEGSGVNDKDRDTQQPRYGPALAGRGDCYHQIHVTDADTPPWRHTIPRQP